MSIDGGGYAACFFLERVSVAGSLSATNNNINNNNRLKTQPALESVDHNRVVESLKDLE